MIRSGGITLCKQPFRCACDNIMASALFALATNIYASDKRSKVTTPADETVELEGKFVLSCAQHKEQTGQDG